MGKLVIIMIVLLAVIVPTIILRVQSRVEKIPDLLYENYRDLGSYALNIGIKKVVSGKITNSELVEYENFQVLDGSIESIEYVFHDNLKEEDESFTDVLIMAEVSWTVRGEAIYHDAEAVLEVVTVSEEGIIATFPEKTIWAVNDETPPLLHYYVLSEAEKEEVPDPDDFVFLEGEIKGIEESNTDIEAFTMDEDGVMYFMNCSGPSVLYKIDPANPKGNIDKDSDTEVVAVKIGNTGMGGSGEITNLEFIDGVLYGIGRSNEKVYSFNNLEPGNFSFTHIADLNVPGSFRTDGLTQGADGEIYLNWTSITSRPSEIWKFNSFPDGGITKVCDITGSKKVEALAAHPNGLLYAADDFHWFSIDPVTHVVEIVLDYEVDIEGIDFYYEAEEIFVEGYNEFKLVYWNPW